MKSRITLLMTVAIFFFATGIFAQDAEMKKNNYPNLKKWEIGLFGGMSNYQGDLIEPIFSLSGDNNNFAYGAHLKYNFNPNWGLGVNYKGSSFSGNESGFEGREGRAYSFGITTDKTPLTEISAQLTWDILGKRRFADGGFKKSITPYLFVGAGYALFDATPDWNGRDEIGGSGAASRARIQEDIDNKETSGFTIPFGGGLNIDLTESVYLGLEAGFRSPFSDYLDGVSVAGDSDDADWYSFAGLKLNYRLGAGKDTDGDGIPDKKDMCPTVPGEVSLEGCPDRDGDGIVDKKDNCPDMAGPADLKGCPDTDGDGIVDVEDQCPQVAGGAALKGCPDTDGDGVIDMEDQCPNTPGLRSMSGCPDSDGDGIVDANDECPNEAGTSLNNGCPDKDTDGDGISDSKDSCPTVAGIGKFAGCPDTDGDGIQDSKDKCPTTPGSTSNSGCPVIDQSSQAIIDLAIQAVRFNTSKSTLLTESYTIMDQVVDVLKRYPDYNVNIMGFTDDRGNAAANQTLSENRAKTCMKYLESKGISRSRITAQGFGETSPIASNDTAEGRRMNRRVEFDLKLR